MKLISIKLYNFRQFYGKTPEIFLATGEERNTTIIFGNNGSGKTGLLNAFTWVLYESFTKAFASPGNLVNQRAVAEAKSGDKVDCSVDISFEHDNRRYRARRQCHLFKGEGATPSRSDLLLQVGDGAGRWEDYSQQSRDVIGRILPLSLHQYFFFDGERIEQIVRPDKKAEIAEATKKLLRVEVIDRSVRHLGEARKTLERNLQAIGDPETQRLLLEKEELEQERSECLERQEFLVDELDNQQLLKNRTRDLLRELEDVVELQRKRDDLEEQARTAEDRYKQSREKLGQLISTRGYTVFLADATQEFRALVENLRAKGELPVGIKRQFVRDLLNNHRCICEAPLLDGSHAYQCVTAWMEKAGLDDVEETAIRMGAQVDELDKRVPEFWREVDREQLNISQSRMLLSRLENQLEDIDDQLRQNPRENIRDIQNRLDKIESKIEEIAREQGTIEERIKILDRKIEDLDKQVSRHQMNEGKQLLTQRRIEVTLDAINRLKQVRSLVDQQFRLQLEEQVQKLFSQISFKPYIPRISENYELSLIESIDGQEIQVAASTGENQILSLAFIGSIIERVREWSKRNTLLGLEGSTFPIVMDSPFGSLDEVYRRQVSRSIPLLANQLIALVTKTQWRGEVEEEMAERIGREYVLTYYSPKPDCERDILVRRGREYALVRPSPSEFEYTEISEVSYGS
ncbi:AAA family ATPase [Anthocerotibacter panamensis]|uniref:AAA family ATPase n=1 Tax=Anthocerotibacter panamensis TaxID=2857077 RepID=UPI001C406B01|nr:AAA family ATPase [Anthocerotibacter panamensis]